MLNWLKLGNAQLLNHWRSGGDVHVVYVCVLTAERGEEAELLWTVDVVNPETADFDNRLQLVSLVLSCCTERTCSTLSCCQVW